MVAAAAFPTPSLSPVPTLQVSRWQVQKPSEGLLVLLALKEIDGATIVVLLYPFFNSTAYPVTLFYNYSRGCL